MDDCRCIRSRTRGLGGTHLVVVSELGRCSLVRYSIRDCLCGCVWLSVPYGVFHSGEFSLGCLVSPPRTRRKDPIRNDSCHGLRVATSGPPVASKGASPSPVSRLVPTRGIPFFRGTM